jgi:hypothetical protein
MWNAKPALYLDHTPLLLSFLLVPKPKALFLFPNLTIFCNRSTFLGEGVLPHKSHCPSMAALMNDVEQLCEGCQEDGNLVSWLLEGTKEEAFQWVLELDNIRSNQGCGMCTMVSQLVPADILENVSLRFQKRESANPGAPEK